MELEQRVKTLEYEMKILKNEVQRTLLDIQEQVLVHYYPALRAEETKPSEGTIQAVEALRSRQGAQPTAPTSPSAAPAAPAPSAAPAVPLSTSSAAPAPSVAPAVPLPTSPAASASTVAPTASPSAAPATFKTVAVAAPPPGTSAVPVLKNVSLEENRAAQSELAAEEAKANPGSVDKLVDREKKPVSESTEGGTFDAATLAERGGVKLLEWLMNSATKVDGERDEKRVNEVLDQLTKLNSLVDRTATMEEALRLIEEGKLG